MSQNIENELVGGVWKASAQISNAPTIIGVVIMFYFHQTGQMNNGYFIEKERGVLC